MPPRKMPAPKPIPQDLVTRTEMPDLFGVLLSTVDTWRARAKDAATEFPFPEPDDYVGPTPVWWLARLEFWAGQTGRTLDVAGMRAKRSAGVYRDSRRIGALASAAAHKTKPRRKPAITK